MQYPQFGLDQEIARVNLKALRGVANGIGGLLTWRRKESTSLTLNEAGLKARHPALYEKFAQLLPGRKFDVVPMRSYE